jgi:GrpB-like predicted nucleotidyltransferase (UPF0157 family)
MSTDEREDPILAAIRAVLIGEPEKVDIVVADYDATWPEHFEIERAKIAAALGQRALAIEHIGSTSVPGLAAKPIIDICLVVSDSSDEASYVADLSAAGYELRVREPEHRMLRTPERDVHVHVLTDGSTEISRLLLFRDWLRANETDRESYQETKRRLAQEDWPTMQHYAEAKSEVVEAIMRRALDAGATSS